MPPKSRTRKGLPKRSRAQAIKLARKFCLRCSKRISDKPEHRCGLKEFQKCTECTRKNKSCDKVCASSHLRNLSSLTASPDSEALLSRGQPPVGSRCGPPKRAGSSCRPSRAGNSPAFLHSACRTLHSSPSEARADASPHYYGRGSAAFSGTSSRLANTSHRL